MSEKLKILEELIAKNGCDAAALMISPNFCWLTEVEKELGERPMLLLAAPGKKPALVLPAFELGAAEKFAIEFEPFTYGDDPAFWGEAFAKAGIYLNLDGKTIAVEPLHLRYRETLYLQNALPGCHIADASEMFSTLRLHKTADEVKKMRKAVEIAQTALDETLKLVRLGVTERELCAELVSQMLRLGSQPQFPFYPIIAGGPNSADPHSAVSDRPLEWGDFLLFDWGARYEGYCSDITRTFVFGEATDKQMDVYHTVLNANQAALESAQIGMECGAVDKAARDVITAKGYGEYFTHRLGHGMGMEDHEEPFMFAGNPKLIEAGMCFSDEPGIYIPNWGGVRIEDDIFMTTEGGIFLTDYPRELRVL